ncbi:FtsW/RodA/SpoVE family cell cycle protein [Metabacillus herbersteinensis]|uniref:FtsW/RodA/SpoVE family cell cycle protein n=1 Tax=Metabacillus herbersteinensis TaxID=283816 RepID=A0ABV6G9X2_9BACI
MDNRKNSFLTEVMEQIRSKEAKEAVSAELSYHIQEAKREWGNKGLTEKEAENKAVEQMGNPSLLGIQMNKLHRPRIDWVMLGLFGTILLIGFLPILSLGYLDESHFATSKIIFVILGGLLACVLMLTDYRKFKRYSWVFYLIGISILVILKQFANNMVFGHPYFILGPIAIESSMALPFLLLAWASFLHNNKLRIWQWGALLLLSLYLLFAVISLPTIFIYIVMVFAMIWWSKIGRKHSLKMSIITVSFLVSASFILWNSLVSYQKDRLLAFVYPEKYTEEAGYQYLFMKELMSSAGWFGNSKGDEFIPSAHTDLVFVSFTYYFGWLFAAILALLLTLLGARIVMTVRKINDPYGKLLLIGCVSLYAVQLAYNLGMTLGFLPITSISFPFISYGLMPTLLNAFLVGIVLSVYRRKDLTFVKNAI